jgi:pyrimidine-specific ribonucleoside hydrolase
MVEMQSKDSKRTLDPRSAIELMRDLINASSEPVTLVPIGPLTNIALFLRAFPDAASKLERIVLMGGSASVGNATATAEFNIWHDPEAAAVVFTSGVPITMYGLDVFTDLQMTPDDAKNLIAKGDKTSLFAGTLVDRFIKQMGHDVTLGDYGAVATAIAPHLAHTKSLRVVVDTTHGPNRGQTVCDHRPYADIAPESAHTNAPKVDVVLEIDIKAMKDMWLKTITGN